MRTNIDIDDALMAAALKAGPYKTKKDAVEAGLKMIAQAAAYREIQKWRGKLQWDAPAWSEPDRYAPNPAKDQPAARAAAKKAIGAAKKVTRHGGR